jgi:hypothetical protein
MVFSSSTPPRFSIKQQLSCNVTPTSSAKFLALGDLIMRLNPVRFLDVTIKRSGESLFLFEALPSALCITDASLYVTFTYSKIHVTVWTAAVYAPDERKFITKQVLNHLNAKLARNNVSSASVDGNHGFS